MVHYVMSHYMWRLPLVYTMLYYVVPHPMVRTVLGVIIMVYYVVSHSILENALDVYEIIHESDLHLPQPRE